MKTVKRVIIFITCLMVLLSSFCLGSWATDVEYDPYTGFEFNFDTDKYYDPHTGFEVIYDEPGDYYYSVHQPLEYDPVSLYRASSPNFSSFDINKLPWLDMPSYVQDILYSEPIGLLNMDSGEYTGDYKLPFVSVQVTSTGVAICAGYNLCLGAYFTTQAK